LRDRTLFHNLAHTSIENLFGFPRKFQNRDIFGQGSSIEFRKSSGSEPGLRTGFALAEVAVLRVLSVLSADRILWVGAKFEEKLPETPPQPRQQFFPVLGSKGVNPDLHLHFVGLKIAFQFCYFTLYKLFAFRNRTAVLKTTPLMQKGDT